MMDGVEIVMPGPQEERPNTPIAPAEMKKRTSLKVDSRERLVFPLLWLWCALLWEVMAGTATGWSLGLGATVLMAAFYAGVWSYCGPPKTAFGRLRLASNLLLALTYALTSRSEWFRAWNALFLVVLVPIQLFDWTGAHQRHLWSDPRMVAQRWLGGFLNLFQRTGVNLDILTSYKKNKHKSLLWVGLGLALAIGLSIVVLPLLMTADALFSQFARRWAAWLGNLPVRWLLWLVMGMVMLPFLMSLLYTVRQPETAPLPKIEGKVWTVEPTLWLTALVVLDVLYVLFLGVQSAALFGGPEYLARAGISYADYARSGFFQLVWVVFLNLSVLLLAVQLSHREGKAWRGVQALGSLLLAESGVLLVSAAWRMTLYVTTYGLTFKRVLTYWGMAVATVFLTAALIKLWRPKFRYFRVLFSGGLAFWLILNAINPAYLSARYNVAAYQRGDLTTMDAEYLTALSYDALGPLSELPPDTTLDGRRLEEVVASARSQAFQECQDWRTWNLSAYLAANGQ